MALRTGHGSMRGQPVIEVAPVDELPVGLPAPSRPAPNRDGSGRFQPGAGTSEIARQGGKALAESRQLAQLLGLWEPPADHPFAPYQRLCREFRDAHMAQLAASVGGGVIGAGVASIISTAAQQMAASRWAYDEGAKLSDAKLLLESSRLGDASRQNLLAAHELAAREAKARPRSKADVPDYVQDAMNNQAKGRK